MGILVKKQKGIYVPTNIAKLSVVALIVSLSAAFIDTIWALYFDSFLNNMTLVGFLSSVLTIVSFLSYFLFIPIIEKFNKVKIYSYSLFLLFFSYILFSINRNFYLFLVLVLSVTVIYTFKITSFGIIIRDNSKDRSVSNNQGIIYTLANIAWVVGPIISGFVFSFFGINKVFLLSALFLLFGLIIFNFSGIKDPKGKKRLDRNAFKNFKDFFKDKERRLAYILGGGVNTWWSFIYLFIPLMIIRSELSHIWIGYFLFAVAVPLILFEYFFAKLAGKKGFKKLFVGGYFLVSIIALVCFFISNIYLILSLLVLASMGIAMLEPTTEAYFLDLLKGKEKYRFYGPYNTAMDFGNFTGKIFSSVLLIFLPFKFLFILFGVMMFVLCLASFRIKKIIEIRRN
ncbi:MAG: MFS transporter [archaeon]